ncbi:unnamed protein product [Owenia fusiformis]|uniref:nicotinamidase n=1 Tax=Owenia fusiformis TaxID=6347 RepID=A0A8S4NBX3_OWEFU|nr:unnamed protein product [Owenia fusiformis]
MANVNTGSRSRIMDTNKQNTPNFIENCLKCHATSSAEKLNECFKSFDMNKDGKLDLKEFDHFLGCLFSKNGKPYPITEKQRKIIHNLLDENKDGKIDYEEFRIIWYHWLKQILDPVTALLVVDVQNDFITGSLAIKDCPAGQDGEAIIPVINKMLDTVKFDCVVYSYDWHPPNHISFVDNVKSWKVHNSSKVPADIAKLYDTVTFDGDPIKVQKLWPAHCIQNSWGSQLHPDLKVVENACHVNKGKNPEIDSYSAFWDNNKLSQTELVSELTKRGVTDVYVCGVAYDVCVGAQGVSLGIVVGTDEPMLLISQP